MATQPRLASRRVLPLLIVLVLLASGLSVVLALTRPNPQPPADLPGSGIGAYEVALLAGEGGPGIEAMVRVLPVVLGYDYRDLNAGLAKSKALMTPQFAREFAAAFKSSARPLAIREQAVVEARVRGAGLVRVVGATVVGLAYVDQVLVEGDSLDAGDESRVLSRNRVLVRLLEVSDSWVISNISPV